MASSPNEYLLNNFLDKEFQNMLLPLNLMQKIFLQSKFKIMHGFITPNNALDNWLCVLGAALVTLSYIFRCFNTLTNSITPIKVIAELQHLVLLVVTLNLLFHGAFSIIISIANIHKAGINVELILRIQHAYKVLREDDVGIKRFRNNNWAYLALLFAVYVLISAQKLVFLHLSDVVWLVSTIYFDANILFGIRMVIFLVYELKMLKKKLDIYGAITLDMNIDDVNEHGKKLFRAYIDIMKAFKLAKEVLHASILYLSAETFGHFLLAIQYIITAHTVIRFLDKISVFGVYILLLGSSWSVKNFVLLSCLCAACQQFYKAAADVDATCSMLLGRAASKHYAVRRLCKNVRRASSFRSVLCAGGAIEMCAAMPLRQLQLIATYTVVLLQFAFL